MKSAKTNNDLFNFGRWLTNEDAFSDVIISSRIRLARNLEGVPFPNRASQEHLEGVIKKVKAACGKSRLLTRAAHFDIGTLSALDSRYLVERRLASPQFVASKKPALLVVAEEESLSIMINEEDHLRIQTLEAGLGIQNAWRAISTADDELGKALTFSFSSQFGYLTACPTNIGTGLRVSIFIHLPALALAEQATKALDDLPTSEIAVRGFYGEGTDSVGNIYQISNQLTLGLTEKGVIRRMLDISQKIVEAERKARADLISQNRIKLEDAVYRAWAVLKSARLLSSLEAMNLISSVRLGLESGVVKHIKRSLLNRLMVLVQPAHLQKIFKKDLQPQERDIYRANFIREYLKDKSN
ncbi:MAG TPA: protein arginine kinase [bacterium]